MRGVVVARGAGLGVTLGDVCTTVVGLGAGGSTLVAVGLWRGAGGKGSGLAKDLLATGLAGSASGPAAGAGAPNSGATSAAASAGGSGEVAVRPTESVKVTVMRSGDGITGTDGGCQASQAISRACRLAATTSPILSSLAGRKEARRFTVRVPLLQPCPEPSRPLRGSPAKSS